MRILFSNSLSNPFNPDCPEKPSTPPAQDSVSRDNLITPNAAYFEAELNFADKPTCKDSQKPVLAEANTETEEETEKIGFTDIPQITSDEEYDEVMAKLKKTGSWSTYWESGRANKWEAAILPYAGKEDRSCVFNIYMGTGRICDPRFTEDAVRDHVRTMHYALQKFDEEHGKYEGIVYRCGDMYNPATSFVSTTCDPDGLNAIITDREDYHKPFYIIYTKHGHKIYEMQDRISTNYTYQREKEVILDPGKQYEEITEITPEMEELKKNLQYAVRDEYCRVHDLNVTFLKEV